jgi:hypothetical protein
LWIPGVLVYFWFLITRRGAFSPLRRPNMSTGSLHTQDSSPGGTGDRFAQAIIIVAGVAALGASLITVLYVYATPKFNPQV